MIKLFGTVTESKDKRERERWKSETTRFQMAAFFLQSHVHAQMMMTVMKVLENSSGWATSQLTNVIVYSSNDEFIINCPMTQQAIVNQHKGFFFFLTWKITAGKQKDSGVTLLLYATLPYTNRDSLVKRFRVHWLRLIMLGYTVWNYSLTCLEKFGDRVWLSDKINYTSSTAAGKD